MFNFQAPLPLVRARGDHPGTDDLRPEMVSVAMRSYYVSTLYSRLTPDLSYTHMKPFHIKSNSCRNILDLGSDIDLEVDISPFVQCNKNPEGQANYVFNASLPYLETEPLK